MSTSKPVLVTGATGYVAGWLVKKLLDEGMTVHAPVRDPDNQTKVQPLMELAANAPGSIRFFKADLLQDGSYDEAMAGCGVVFHTASPFKTKIKDPQRDLVDPALLGTQNVLQSANRTESVERVVVTSSVAAIYSDNVDAQAKPGKTLTEEYWNENSTLDHNPYQYSKTLAEKAAWEIAEAQNSWQLRVVNPSLVLGPAIGTDVTSESFRIIKLLCNGTSKAGVPVIGIGVVDVRDLADGHFRVAFEANAAGRHIMNGHNSSMLDMAKALPDALQKRLPLPKKTLPKWLVWAVAPAAGFSRKFVKRNMGMLLKLDNSKAQALGVTFRPLTETMTDQVEQMLELGMLKAK